MDGSTMQRGTRSDRVTYTCTVGRQRLVTLGSFLSSSAMKRGKPSYSECEARVAFTVGLGKRTALSLDGLVAVGVISFYWAAADW
eukprot:scaffold1652_cov45-Attheya_sp.AAC.1